jgi:hypothetical protein
MSPQPSENPRPEKRGGRAEPGNLDSLYGAIGMPVVAAAARYPSEARNPACKPATFAPRDPEDAVA